jgi:hypothetical protein
VSAQAVEDKEGCISHLFKELIVAHIAFGAEGSAEMVEKVRDILEENGIAELNT